MKLYKENYAYFSHHTGNLFLLKYKSEEQKKKHALKVEILTYQSNNYDIKSWNLHTKS